MQNLYPANSPKFPRGLSKIESEKKGGGEGVWKLIAITIQRHEMAKHQFNNCEKKDKTVNCLLDTPVRPLPEQSQLQ